MIERGKGTADGAGTILVTLYILEFLRFFSPRFYLVRYLALESFSRFSQFLAELQ